MQVRDRLGAGGHTQNHGVRVAGQHVYDDEDKYRGRDQLATRIANRFNSWAAMASRDQLKYALAR